MTSFAAFSADEAPPSVPAYGLLPAADFRLVRGDCADCAGLPQAMWFFRKETIAIPREGLPQASYARELRAVDDLRSWHAATPLGQAPDYPSLVWAASPDTLPKARLDPEGRHWQTPTATLDFALAPQLASNRSYYNAASGRYFAGRELRLRGTFGDDGRRFVARSLWPADYRLPLAPALAPLPGAAETLPAALRDAVRSEAHGGFDARLLWQRSPEAASPRPGQAVLGLMLNGAQGDDDEAHGGHFALLTGRVGAQGAMHDWLVANYYTLDSESEKGIIAALQPLDGYLGDLNSGQSWYRPSWMLVVTLRESRTADHLHSALARVFNQFYRHQFVYQHAVANCTGISVSTLRSLDWQVPAQGATSWWKAALALPGGALATGSLEKGKALFDYLTEDQTRLFPAQAFEQAGADLLRLAGGQTGRTLSPFERALAEDIEAIHLVRVPQFPSSRAFGTYPVAGVDEYRARLPQDPAQRQIVPVGPRPFPVELKDPLTPERRLLRSDYALAVGSVLLAGLAAWALRAWRRRRPGSPRP